LKKNEIMQMARQAGLKEQFTTNKDAVVKKGFAMSGAFIGYKSDFDALEAFAKLVAEHERQRLHDKFMQIHEQQKHSNNYFHFAARKIKEEA
jgi:hypothetical protein